MDKGKAPIVWWRSVARGWWRCWWWAHSRWLTARWPATRTAPLMAAAVKPWPGSRTIRAPGPAVNRGEWAGV